MFFAAGGTCVLVKNSLGAGDAWRRQNKTGRRGSLSAAVVLTRRRQQAAILHAAQGRQNMSCGPPSRLHAAE